MALKQIVGLAKAAAKTISKAARRNITRAAKTGKPWAEAQMATRKMKASPVLTATQRRALGRMNEVNAGAVRVGKRWVWREDVRSDVGVARGVLKTIQTMKRNLRKP